jgi:hypothetical protein
VHPRKELEPAEAERREHPSPVEPGQEGHSKQELEHPSQQAVVVQEEHSRLEPRELHPMQVVDLVVDLEVVVVPIDYHGWKEQSEQTEQRYYQPEQEVRQPS